MTITLTPRETACLIVDRANELQELVNQKCEPKHRDIWRAALRTLENRIWEAVNHLNDITNLCGVGESSKPEGAPIPPEGEVPQPCEPTDEQRKVINRIRETTTKLANMATYKYDGRELSRDAAEAVGALEELVEAVKTLYGLSDDEDVEPADCVK